MTKLNHVSGLIARELHGKRQGAAFCLMTACCEEQWKLLTPAKKKKHMECILHPPPFNFLFFCFFLFQGFSAPECLALPAKAVLTMTQNIIQEQKDEARRIVEEQVACYIGCLVTREIGHELPFPSFLGLSWNLANVGTWGKQHILVMKPEMQSSQIFRVYFLHLFIVSTCQFGIR